MGNEIEPDCKFVHCMPTNVHSLKILNNICVSFVCMLRRVSHDDELSTWNEGSIGGTSIADLLANAKI